MRLAAAAVIAAFPILLTAPAHAEFPWALRASGGIGLLSSGLAGVGAVEVVWRRAADRAIVLGAEAAGTLGGHKYPLDRYWPGYFTGNPDWHESLVLSMERSTGRPVAGYVQGGLGIGRTRAPGRTPDMTYGFAMSAVGGLRITPRPGPVGILLGARWTHVHTHRSVSSAAGFAIGITIHPQRRTVAAATSL